jgi:ABC-type transport system involved in multi-copper enzyme maturation permease subunit
MTVVEVPLTAPAGAGVATRFTAALRAELTKIRSLRSTYWTLIGAVIALIGLGALFCGVFIARHPAGEVFGDIWRRSLRGVALAQIAIGVLGILAMTGEFGTGMIRSTVAAVPNRRQVLAAKAVVFSAVSLVITTVASFAAFFVGQAILHRDGFGVSISDPGVARSVMGIALFLTVLSLFAVALGTIVRHTAGAVAALFGILLVAPLLAEALPAPWSGDIGRYLPGDAGLALSGVGFGPGTPLAPWTGFLVFCGWTLALLAVATWLFDRRDV